MDLKECRERIDAVDKELVSLFAERMRISADVAAWKKANGLPVRDETRETQKLKSVGEMAGEELRPYTEELFSTLMALSRAYQHHLNGEEAGR